MAFSYGTPVQDQATSTPTGITLSNLVIAEGQAIFCGFFTEGFIRTVTSVTWNGSENLNPIIHHNYASATAMAVWYGLLTPTATTANVVVTLINTVARIGAVAIGVGGGSTTDLFETGSPTGNDGGAEAANEVTIDIPGADGNLVFAGFAHADTEDVTDAYTNIMNQLISNDRMKAQRTEKSGASAITMDWSGGGDPFDNSEWAAAGFSYELAAGADASLVAPRGRLFRQLMSRG